MREQYYAIMSTFAPLIWREVSIGGASWGCATFCGSALTGGAFGGGLAALALLGGGGGELVTDETLMAFSRINAVFRYLSMAA